MEKEQLKSLLMGAEDVLSKVAMAIRDLTAENPLILFDQDEVKESAPGDELWEKLFDLPFGYTVGKYGDYNQGVVCEVKGREVTLFLTGEDEFGGLFYQDVEELPFSSQIDLLCYLMDRM